VDGESSRDEDEYVPIVYASYQIVAVNLTCNISYAYEVSE